MITKESFKELLLKLEFQEHGKVFTKNIRKTQLKIDFTAEKIIYPDKIKINEKTTCNLNSNENFVVFECIYRLLEKGYQPEHLELEPRWQLGHGASGGRADILVKNHENKPLLIIECKTAGEEFEKEKQKMLSHGGQLFSYLQQEKSTQYLCLYTSDYQANKINYESAIVKIIDSKENIEDYRDDDSIKLYQNADNKKELFEVWKETYNFYFHYNGIFEEDAGAYQIELKPLKRKNLKPFKEASNIFNIFMEILRHNNISDNANAFNRMLSLFLCKIVDEQKSKDEVLGFQIKEGENAETIQDRLQKLYKEGMEEYLNETIVYYEDSEIKKIIENYPRQTPLSQIEEIFKRIKYYTNNEFAIKEVHNEYLFKQNAKILNEIIRMLQNYQFRYTKKDQFLGDFFEQLLTHGVKQSEGQFFTPIPIVRFIILSIGLDKIIQQKLQNGEEQFLPKILDYACGAGHFLTESIDEIQKHIKEISTESIQKKGLLKNLKRYKEDTKWAKDYIFGIEKDYRLARTSQIACFINGDGDANIIFGDGLENHEELALNKKFDLIIANPPYAIKSFKNYLNIKKDDYTLYNDLTESSKEIETMFVERTAQVLATGGNAGIILPSSMLNNGSNLHQKTRTILLENFEIKAISEFGGNTFGATGTSTIVLFLKKRSPDFLQDRKYISEDLFNGRERKRKLEHIDSALLLEKFIKYRGFEPDDYKNFLKKQTPERMLQSEQWQEYQNWFDDLTEIKKHKKKKFFQDLTLQEQTEELTELFYKKILPIEQEKFYIFMLTLNDNDLPQKVVISTVKDKNSLGYEFSTRKGDEGIKINKNNSKEIETKLYDETNYNSSAKINSYILKNNYDEAIVAIDSNLTENVQLSELPNMLDFNKVIFDKIISLHPKQNSNDLKKTQEEVKRKPKWEMKQLGGLIKTISPPKKIAKSNYVTSGQYPIVDQSQNKTAGWTNDKTALVPIVKPLVIFGDHTCIVKYIDKPFAQGADGIKIMETQNNLLPKFLFFFLKTKPLKPSGYQRHFTNLKQIKIPTPPIEVQKKIVQECEAVEEKATKVQEIITNEKNQITELVQKIVTKNYTEKKLGEVAVIKKGTSITEENTEVGNIKVVAGGINFAYYHNIANRPAHTITISASGANAGYVNYWKESIFASDCTTALGNDTNNTKYIYQYLKYIQNKIFQLARGAAQPHVYPDDIKQIKIPVPPLEIQKNLVAEVEKIEKEMAKYQVIIDSSKEEKNAILENYLYKY